MNDNTNKTVYDSLLPVTPGLKDEVIRVLTKASQTVMPSEDDLRGAAHSLARLQNIYRIPIGNFMAGRIHDTVCSASKPSHICIP